MSITATERVDEWAQKIASLSAGERVFLLAWGGAMGPAVIDPRGEEARACAQGLELKGVLEVVGRRTWRLSADGARIVMRLERMIGDRIDGEGK